MTDLVNWHERACGVQDKHKPHAYFLPTSYAAGDTFICHGVTDAQALGFAIERLAFQIRAELIPIVEQTNAALIRFGETFRRKFP